MAKKKRKKAAEAEKYEFVPPDFDEKQFLIDEMKATKRVILTVAYGALFGILAAEVTISLNNATIGLLIFILGLASMKYVFPLMRIDLSIFKKRTWVESGAWFFFTFMALWILVYNPPLGDHAYPDIEEASVSIYMDGSGWIRFNYSYDSENEAYIWVNTVSRSTLNLEDSMNSSSRLIVRARIADISGLGSTPRILGGDINSSPVEMSSEGDHYYSYQIESVSQDGFLYNEFLFTFSIIAEDTVGNTHSFEIDKTAEISIS